MNSQNINTICLFILTIFAAAFALSLTKAIMIPFVLSIFMYLIISPAMLWMQNKYKLHHSITLLIAIIIFLTILLVLIALISGSIDSFLDGIDSYKEKVNNAVLFVEQKASTLGYDITTLNIKEKLTALPIFSLLKGLTGSMLNLFSNTFLVVIFTLFLLTGESISTHEIKTLEQVKASIAKYVGTKLFVSALTGGLCYLVFLIVGVDLAIMFAILAVFFNFIPNIGSIISVILPIPVLILQFGFGWETFFVVIATTAFQVVIGNILEPKLLGESMDLHPVTILLFLTFWGFIWGIPGMFLSVPITATLKIIFAKFELTRPIAEIFAGRLAVN
jgi:AI-2 transport protein TqsA